MNQTKIDWADCTVNPVVGCTYGCPFCYARRLNDRFHFVKDFSCPVFFPERLKQLKSKKPKTIFMDSMSDIADWKIGWIKQVFVACAENPQHKYLFLTKRPQALTDWIEQDTQAWCDLQNAFGLDTQKPWYGVTVTSDADLNRAYYLPRVCNKFLSIEPLLFEIPAKPLMDALNNQCIRWVIVGAQTGAGAAHHQPKRQWVQDIVNACDDLMIPVFMKNSLAKIWNEPLIQEFPW